MINLKKNETIDLTKHNSSLKTVILGLGWQGKGGRSLDLDSYVVLLDDNNKVINYAYFGQLRTQGVIHHGDDLVGGGGKNDPNEQIYVSLDNLPSNCTKVITGLFIYSGASNLSQVDYAFVRLSDQDKNELARFKVSDFGDSKSLIVADLTKKDGEWSTTAIGQGENLSYREISNRFFNKGNSVTRNESNARTGSSEPRKGFFSRLFG